MRHEKSLVNKLVLAAVAALFVLYPVASAFPQADDAATTGTDAETGAAQGRSDARGNGLWFFPGLIPGCGLVLPWLFSPKVPADKLIGRSEEYVSAYTVSYVKKAKQQNFFYSLFGQVVTGTIAGAYLLVSCTSSASGCAADLGSEVGGAACSAIAPTGCLDPGMVTGCSAF
jgi:hypothetical protein